MDCQKFLEEYTAWRDGDLSWPEAEAFEAHVDECPSCARYDRVVRRGAALFRDLPELEVSEDFGARLQHSLYDVDEERRKAALRAPAGAAVGTLALAALVAAVAWVPLMRPQGAVPALPAVAVQAPARDFVSRLVSVPHLEATNLTSRLASIGVSVEEMPYHEVVFRPEGALAVLASYESDLGAVPMQTLAR